MEKKRYQVFVSSTFMDLRDERQLVIRTLMEIDCIPAGMELFPAADEEQFEFIKKVIDDCDYYVVIIGGKYGSVSKEGISYTEMEYDYAKKIGLKVLAFLHEDPAQIPAGKSELDREVRQKLEAFRNKLMENRLVSFWKDRNELDRQVMKSVSKAIKMFPAVGWIRGSSVDRSALLQQINDIRTENEELKKKLQESNGDSVFQRLYEDGKASLPLTIVSKHSRGVKSETKKYTIITSWNDVFDIVALKTIERTGKLAIEKAIIRTLGRLADESVREDLRLFERKYIPSGERPRDYEEVSMSLANGDDVMGALCLQKLVEVDDSNNWQITETGKSYYTFMTSNKKGVGVVWGSQGR